MRRAILVGSLWLILAGAARAQPFVSTEAPRDVRYAVVRGGTGVTLRLDKTTGRVWRLESGGNLHRWIAIPPIAESVTASGVNYQLTVSSEIYSAALVNVHTGATWVLEWAGRRDPVWVPVQTER